MANNMKKIKTNYAVVVSDGGKYYITHSPELSKINPNVALACTVYENSGYCHLYYNDGCFSKDELEKSGYKIVEKILQVDTYVEEKEIMNY